MRLLSCEWTDRSFFHFVRWELHRIWAVRPSDKQFVQFVLIAAFIAIGVGVWAAATVSEPQGKGVEQFRAGAVAFLISIPLRDDVVNLSQLSFGYTLLRFLTYFLVAIAKIVLPAMAYGSVAGHRRTGGLRETQLTSLTTLEIYLGKSVAVAVPLLALGAALSITFTAVFIAEYVPIVEIARLLLEMSGQITLLAFVTVTCSAVCGWPWVAMGAAYVLLWFVIPFGWLSMLVLINPRIADSVVGIPGFVDLSFTWQCAVHALFTVGCCAIALVVGVLSLHTYGAPGAVRIYQRRGTAPQNKM